MTSEVETLLHKSWHRRGQGSSPQRDKVLLLEFTPLDDFFMKRLLKSKRESDIYWFFLVEKHLWKLQKEAEHAENLVTT